MVDRFLQFRETRGWKILKVVQEVVIVIAAAATCLLFVAEVIARYILKTDFLGYDELVLLAVVWLYFIGGGYAMYKKAHINADMISLMFKGRKLQIARLFTTWITFAVAIVLVIWGVQFTDYALEKPAYTTVLKIPKIAAQVSLVIGYILVSFYSLFYSIEDTIRVIRKVEPEEEHNNSDIETIDAGYGEEGCANE